jgi:signal transduction histidine kinase/tetratricopeptide (TPR) repeat protein
MKYKRFYSLFPFFLFLIGIASCNQKKSDLSVENLSVISKINDCLERAESDSLSNEQKLEYINQSLALAKESNIDSLILKTFNEKAEFYNSFYQDSALTVLKEFEKMANAKKDTLYIAHSLLNLGEYYSALKQNKTAFSYFNKSNIQFKNCKDSSNIVYSLLMMSGILKEKSDFYDMEAVNTEALKFISPTDKYLKHNYTCIYNNLGVALKQTFDYEKSLLYYKKSRQYAESDYDKMILENNIAAVYTLNNQPQKALDILLPLDQLINKEKNAKINSLISNNIGLAYLKLNDSKSLDYFLKGLSIRKAENDTYGLIDCYAHLANYYKTNKNTIPLAKKYALKSYEEATKLDVVEERLHALELLATTSYGKESSDYLKFYFKLNDSLSAEKQKNKNQFAKIKYDFSAQMDQNQKLKTQQIEKNLKLANSNNQILLLLILGVTGIGITIFRLNYLKQKSKKEILQEGYNTETRISKQLHDELANDVYHTMTFAETQNLVDENNKEILLNNLELIYKRTRNISKENSTIDTGVNYESNLKEMIADFSSNEINVLINGIESVPFLTMETNKKIILYRVLQELLVNMKKHSHCSIVAISFKTTAQNINIEYSDNGVGIVQNEIILKNGLQNVESRIESIKGSISFDNTSGKGFKTNFSFPI